MTIAARSSMRSAPANRIQRFRYQGTRRRQLVICANVLDLRFVFDPLTRGTPDSSALENSPFAESS